ncbi:permease [Geodermatophilus sp. SYSU D01180]
MGTLLALGVVAAALLWAEWLPYGAEVASLGATHTRDGGSILAVGGVEPGDPPSLHAATTFAGTYLAAVWKALAAALLISAAVQTLVLRAWLLRVLDRRSRLGSAAVGGLVSTPSMTCTCCTAPVAATLRRDGVGTAAVVAHWLGNPLLNPAVLVFLALVAPWQWTVTRLLVGVLVVVGGAALVARLTDRRAVPERFGRTLLRLLVTLVPEYLLVVLAVGAIRGWLVPLVDGSLGAGPLVVVLAAVVGTLLILPTGGEIPVLQGLALAGLSLGGVGAPLLTLTAVSVPGIAMVGRALDRRTTAVTAAVVVAGGGLVGGAVLTVLAG